MINFVPFPELHNANEDGLLAVGGDLDVDSLVSAYAQGIFPWFNNDQPILWWSPDPRLVLYPEQLKISKSLAKLQRQKRYRLSCDQAFPEVISNCALRGNNTQLEDADETWITDSMHAAYIELFNAGYAHSIEVWDQDELVGGLYGVVLGKVFFGESMFSQQNNVSKLALARLCKHLQHKQFVAIDCQVSSAHLLSLGAIEISRTKFIQQLSHIDIQQSSFDFANNFIC